MKIFKLKNSILFFICISLTLLTCDNIEEINQNEDANTSILMRAMSEMMDQFDANGNTDESQNPSGNMALDFCFEFVFPIDFQMNDNSIVTINSIEELVEILIESNDDLYIDDVSYPFDVLVFNTENDSIETFTIENDEVFDSLLEDCEFDLDEDNMCYELYDPVCVEITNADGQIIVLVYPNDCYAGLDGFDEDDFLEDCDTEGDHEDGWFENDCFDLVYPISLVHSNGDVITVNSEEALVGYIEEWYSENCDDMDDCEFDFELQFPVTVEYYSENSQQTQTLVLNSEEELEDYFEDYCE